jgi:hypothetical protein
LGLPPEPTAASSRAGRQLWAALVWGGLGFVAGAVFWHLVGFWSFLSEVVLDRTTGPQAAEAASAPTGLSAKVVLVDSATCTALALDRRAKLTLALPCPEDGLALRLEPQKDAREDLVVLAQPRLQAARYRPD